MYIIDFGFNVEIYLAFVDLQKAFDMFDRVTCEIMQTRGYPIHLIIEIKSTYNGTQIRFSARLQSLSFYLIFHRDAIKKLKLVPSNHHTW